MINILTANLVLSTAIFGIVARLYLAPILNSRTSQAVLVPILLLHMSRHFGLMFLSSGATYPGMPHAFASPAAIGDLVAALLAGVALLVIVKRLRGQKIAVWSFNLWGVADLAAAIALATVYGAEPFMGAAYWIPALWVPALLASHYVTFVILINHWPDENRPAAGINGAERDS
jgi:hypothetical protein